MSPTDRRDALLVGVGVAFLGTLAGLALQRLAVGVGLRASLGSQSLAWIVLAGLTLATGFAGAATAYLYGTDRGPASLGLSVPALRELGCVIALTAACILAQGVYGLFVPIAESDVVLALSGREWLVFGAVAALLINPAEELLYRGVVQSRLGESLPTAAAVLLAGFLFALTHLPSYTDPTVAEALGLLGAQTLLGSLMGVGYARTGNVLVPVGVHSLYSVWLYGMLSAGLA